MGGDGKMWGLLFKRVSLIVFHQFTDFGKFFGRIFANIVLADIYDGTALCGGFVFKNRERRFGIGWNKTHSFVGKEFATQHFQN
jgi:hypothetical protein